MRRAALFATTLLAATAGMHIGWARAQSATEAQAQAYQHQFHAWLQSVVGPKPVLPGNLLTFEAAGDHYVLSFPVMFAAAGARWTADAIPQSDGKWAIDKMKLPSPMTVTAPMKQADGTTQQSTVTLTLGSQTGQMLLDTKFATASTWTSGIGDASLTVERGDNPLTATIKQANSVYTLQPTTGDRASLTGQVEIADYKVETVVPDNQQKLTINLGRVKARLNVDDVSRGTLQLVVQDLVRSSLEQANAGAAGGTAGGDPKEAGKAFARRLFALMPDLLSGIGFEESAENTIVEMGGMQGSLHGLLIGVSGKSSGGQLTLKLTVGADGLVLPDLGLGDAAELIPSKISIPLTISGLDSAHLAAVMNKAAESDQPPNAEAMEMLTTGKVAASLDNLVLDMGGAELRGTGHLRVLSATDVTGTGQFSIENLDALQEKIAATPELAQGGAVLIFLKGIGRTTGTRTVWDVNFADRKLIVNGQDLAAMMGGGGGGAGAGRPAPRTAPSSPAIPPGEQLRRR